MISIKDTTFFCSWSGGKDSSLALYRAIREGGRPHSLLTMLTEDGKRTRSHGLPVTLIQKQALVLGISLAVHATSWDNYETTFTSSLFEFKKKGINVGVFGDIDIDANREWTERVCTSAAIQLYQPLWKRKRGNLLKELFEVGFKAVVVAVKNGVLDKQFLGKTLDVNIVQKFESIGIDPSGEKGEYHTVVTDGPIFSAPLYLDMKKTILRDGYWFLDVSTV